MIFPKNFLPSQKISKVLKNIQGGYMYRYSQNIIDIFGGNIIEICKSFSDFSQISFNSFKILYHDDIFHKY